jgi:AraC family transcriptional regulator of adaptative response/methylated-DNA-[protein]-cysteine methyltransferase
MMDQRAPHADAYASEEARWEAVRSRDRRANGYFHFAVETTGVYCLPSCGARQPRRENVRFYDTAEAAEHAGYRACKRCKPGSPPLADRHSAIAAAACRQIDEAEEEPNLEMLSDTAGMSPSYFNRTFKKVVGVTPKQYAMARRSESVRRELAAGESVTGAIYAAGYGASSRFYESARSRLGMKPSDYRAGGLGASIRYATGRSWLGPVIVAATEKGICGILFADDEDALLSNLEARFPEATLEAAEPGSDFERWFIRTLASIEKPELGFELPLDVKGTAFQERVWRALREIPFGETASYAEVAAAIGSPKSARAVAGACAANPVAIAIPCHRVVRGDGNISGYRWGVEKKAKLLANETKGKA